MNAPSITDNQNSVAIQACITATIMIAHQVAGKATRDGLFLSSFAVTDLPKAVMASAVLSFFAVLLMSRIATAQPGLGDTHRLWNQRIIIYC